MGAAADGRKELIAISDGFRESEQSWRELLLDVRARGVTIDPKLAIGDGALGFRKARRPGRRGAGCLARDREALLAFYDFPAEHWLHIRTTNAIESVFATVRLRTEKTRGSGSRVACLTMVFKLMGSASKKWRCLNGSELIRDVIAGITFTDGIRAEKTAA